MHSTTRTPPHAAWRRGAAGDAQSLAAATRARGEASVLHPRRDHSLRSERLTPEAGWRRVPNGTTRVRPCCCLRWPARALQLLPSGLSLRPLRRSRRGALPPGGPPPSALGRASPGGRADPGVMHRSASVSRYQPPGYTCPPPPPALRVRGPSPSSPSEGERAYGCAENPILPTGIRPCLLPNECSDVSAPGRVIPLPFVGYRAAEAGVPGRRQHLAHQVHQGGPAGGRAFCSREVCGAVRDHSPMSDDCVLS